MTSDNQPARTSGLVRGLLEPRFILCVVLLAACGAGLQLTKKKLGMWFHKQALPLKQPLTNLNKEALAPYRLLKSHTIDAEVLDSLGTKQYIQWFLEDPELPRNDPRRVMVLFVTYYTGIRDPVPHVPEVCYLGGGFQRQGARRDVVKIPELGVDVPVRATTFLRPIMGGEQQTTVVYTFNCNGKFTPDRAKVRTWMSNPFERYGYYSKVEITCARGDAGASPAQVIEAAKKLLRKVLPLLVRDHWPDWEQATRRTEAGGAPSRASSSRADAAPQASKTSESRN